MAKPKVYIGIGHGGYDPGAVGNGLKEKDLNLAIGLACGEYLSEHGVTVMMSRTTDLSEGTAAKAAECNAFDPDLAGDIHINAGGGDGAEVWHHHGGGKGLTLANNILAKVKEIGQNSRGTKTRKNSAGLDYFGFIRLTNCPAVIVECAFIDTKKDIAIIDTAAEQKAMGVAIAKGFLATLGIDYQAEAAEPEDKPAEAATDTFYRVIVEKADRKQLAAYKSQASAAVHVQKLNNLGITWAKIETNK